MDEKERKSHGMPSEKASRIKVRGHNKEFLFADLIQGKVVKGTNKVDVIDLNGKSYTIKGGSEIKGEEGRDGRWQLFLFTESKFVKEEDFPARDFMLNILRTFPRNREDYLLNEEPTKEKVGVIMAQLKEYFTNKNNIYSFFDKSIFNFQIDFLVIYHDDSFHIFERTEVLNCLRDFSVVRNSKGLQKVIFDYDNKILLELEVRKSDGKYPSMLLNTNKLKIMKLLLDKIEKKENFNRSIILHGLAIKKFKNN